MFVLRLEPGENRELECRITAGGTIEPSPAARSNRAANFVAALEERQSELVGVSRADWARHIGQQRRVRVDDSARGSRSDFACRTTATSGGAFIMAGVPWFATLFGRDSIITALSVLAVSSSNRGCEPCGRWRSFRAIQVDEARDEQPGKIVHEIRSGEMAATGEIPFGRYYGSVDATPLFLWLYGRCVESTGDLDLARRACGPTSNAPSSGSNDGVIATATVTSNICAKLRAAWPTRAGRIPRTRFFISDGELARPPIALAEVQGYVYAACTSVASVATRLGHRTGRGSADSRAPRR